MEGFNPEELGSEIDFLLPAELVLSSLNQFIEWSGKPLVTRVGNDPECVSSKQVEWAETQGIALNYI